MKHSFLVQKLEGGQQSKYFREGTITIEKRPQNIKEIRSSPKRIFL